MADQYTTLSSAGTATYTARRSRFLAFAYPVSSAEEARGYVAALRKEHHAARHVCWAYRLSPAGSEYRYNDDGEPHGTAGQPIYGQLLSANIVDAVVVVVRYYGGVNLGTGGLVVAYRTAAAQALAAAEKVVRTVSTVFEYSVPYSLVTRVVTIVEGYKGALVAATYGDPCVLRLAVPAAAATACRQHLAALCPL